MTTPEQVAEIALLEWLRRRHDGHMNRAGWLRNAAGEWRRAGCHPNVETHNEWVGKANEVFAIIAAIRQRAHLERTDHAD